jgi:hypothetical protein
MAFDRLDGNVAENRRAGEPDLTARFAADLPRTASLAQAVAGRARKSMARLNFSIHTPAPVTLQCVH